MSFALLVSIFHILCVFAFASELGPALNDMNLAVVVLSSRDNIERRNAIRETWAKGHSNVYFFVGKHCPYKPEQRKDWLCEPRDADTFIDLKYNAEQELLTQKLLNEPKVILVDMIDVYRNLPDKLIQSYIWINTHTSVKYILKMDDDSFARVDSVDHWLQNRVNVPKYEWIAFHFLTGVQVFKVGKNAEFKYSGDVYPPYPYGSGHILSIATIRFLLNNLDTWVQYQGEDTSLAIWRDRVKSAIDIVLTTEKQFIPESGDCHNTQKFVISHNISPEKMRACYNTMDEYKYIEL